MFQWLKNKVFKNELSRLKKSEESIEKLSTTILELQRYLYKSVDALVRAEGRLKEATAESSKLISEASELRATITKLINIGVDISRPPDKSWAVVCIGGKPEYVAFR